MRNNYWWILALGFAMACNQTPQQPDSKQAEKNAGNAGLTFAFSKQAPVSGAAPGNKWCRVTFPEAAVISADPANFNRRLFALGEGPHKVMVDFTNMTAAFVLQKSGNHVEIFTSDNYPECLSNRLNFSIGADGTTFHYDNKMHIDFDMQLIPLPNGIQIALEMAPEAGYGIIVRR